MPFFKCIFKDLLTNLNVRFCFFPKTWQLKTTHLPNETNFVWKKLSHFATIPYFKFNLQIPYSLLSSFVWYSPKSSRSFVSLSSGQYLKLTKVKFIYVIHFILSFYNIELFNYAPLVKSVTMSHRKHQRQLCWINLTLVRT